MVPFIASVWPEEAAPAEASQCQRCELCKQRSRVVWGEGNPYAPVFILLDNPGAREDRQGAPFVCGTRETLQKAAFEAGFQPELLYVTYLLKCRPLRAYEKQSARSACLFHLNVQLAEKRPAAVFCMGNVAVQSFFDDPEAEVKLLRGRRHEVRGYPTFVTYHPLAVRRRPNLYRLFVEDWVFLKKHVMENL